MTIGYCEDYESGECPPGLRTFKLIAQYEEIPLTHIPDISKLPTKEENKLPDILIINPDSLLISRSRLEKITECIQSHPKTRFIILDEYYSFEKEIGKFNNVEYLTLIEAPDKLIGLLKINQKS